MAELVEIIEPAERQFVVRLTETEANALLFLSDIVTDIDSQVEYRPHYADKDPYIDFKDETRKIMENVKAVLQHTGGYGHPQDYMRR